jgi:hypothetical protein
MEPKKMPKWQINYYDGNCKMAQVVIEAPTAADALTLFDVNVKLARVAPYPERHVYDISEMACVEMP